MRLHKRRLTVRTMMAAIMVVAVFLSAWLYRHENRDVETSLTSIQLRAAAQGNSHQRRSALENLSNTGFDDIDRVFPALAAGMADDDRGVRHAATRSLGLAGCTWARASNGTAEDRIALAIRLLVRRTDDPETEVRLESLRSLRALYDAILAPTAAPHRQAALAAIAKEEQAVARFERRMHDVDTEVRVTATAVFARFAPLSGERPDAVLELMTNDPVPEVRAAAVGAVATGWPEPDWLYPLLLRRAEEVPTLIERSTIGWSLANLPPPPAESVPALVKALSLDNYALNNTVPTALAKLGTEARPALPALSKAAARELEDPTGSALWAAQAIASIDKDSAQAQALLGPIVARLRDAPRNFDRQQAAVVLAKYGRSGAAAVQSLRGALKSEVPDVRERAAFLLGSIGPPAQPALADLAGLAGQDPDVGVRNAASNASKRIKVD